MKLDGIINLYKEMKRAKELRQQFEYAYNSTRAKVLFLIDNEPFLICFSQIGGQLYVDIELKKGFELNTYLPTDKLSKLKEIFNVGNGYNGNFKTNDFFTHFNKRIPKNLRETRVVPPCDLPKRNDIEDAERIYFYRFYPHKNEKPGVTKENLDKTEALLGLDARIMCEKHNITTQWKDIPRDDNFNKWKVMLKKACDD